MKCIMKTYGFPFPEQPRKTALAQAEEWYQHLLSERLGRPLQPIRRSNFGQYDMAVNYLTSVIEEARAIEKVAVFNIDHMAQIRFQGPDAAALLDRVLPARITDMKIGQCKYTLLLTPRGTVVDDLIVMRRSEDCFIAVINAGHDITGQGTADGHDLVLTADADLIAKHLRDGENVEIRDISAELVKIDIQGPQSYKLITALYGESILANRSKPDKPMAFFTFNDFELDGMPAMISRTGYTNRWGWEMYVPVSVADREFRRIVEKALEMGGLLVGLGGRDENRISAGPVGLPLNGQEYSQERMATHSPLFNAAVDLTKETFVGREALLADRANTQRQVLIITEGIATGCAVYADGKRLGVVTSSINSPNVPVEKRLFIGSARKNVIDPNGTAAIGLAWLDNSPFAGNADGSEILEVDGQPVRIRIECFRLDENGHPTGKPLLGFISADGVNPATAALPLKNIM